MNENQPVMPFAAKQGLVLGLISIIISLLTYVLELQGETMINVLSFAIVVGFLVYAYKNYKQLNEGYMSYGQAIGIAVLICLISGVLSGAFVAVYTSYVDPTIMDAQIEESIMRLEEQGMTDEQIDTAMEMTKMMMTPTFMFIGAAIGSTLMGFIISLILGAFMKNPRPEFE